VDHRFLPRFLQRFVHALDGIIRNARVRAAVESKHRRIDAIDDVDRMHRGHLALVAD
jgi:hypothetical protein